MPCRAYGPPPRAIHRGNVANALDWILQKTDGKIEGSLTLKHWEFYPDGEWKGTIIIHDEKEVESVIRRCRKTQTLNPAIAFAAKREDGSAPGLHTDLEVILCNYIREEIGIGTFLNIIREADPFDERVLNAIKIWKKHADKDKQRLAAEKRAAQKLEDMSRETWF